MYTVYTDRPERLVLVSGRGDAADENEQRELAALRNAVQDQHAAMQKALGYLDCALGLRTHYYVAEARRVLRDALQTA